ncbi:MAG: histidine kinase [Tardiphaga sp.]|nr:histidine kinase [Tardiphaga sp.]
MNQRSRSASTKSFSTQPAQSGHFLPVTVPSNWNLKGGEGAWNLANQATDKITSEIESLNGISGDVVSGLASIKQAIQHVNEDVTSTAAAVEEQSAVTSDISTNMQRAAAELA